MTEILTVSAGRSGAGRHGSVPGTVCVSVPFLKMYVAEPFVLAEVDPTEHFLKLLITHRGVSAVGILSVDLFLYLCDERSLLVDRVVSGEPEIAVHPEGDAGKTAVGIDGDGCGAAEDLFGIEYVVYLLILEKSVGVDACAGGIS